MFQSIFYGMLISLSTMFIICIPFVPNPWHFASSAVLLTLLLWSVEHLLDEKKEPYKKGWPHEDDEE